MSYSRQSRTSAYQVYSSHKSNSHATSRSLDLPTHLPRSSKGSHSRSKERKCREPSSDSDDDVLKPIPAKSHGASKKARSKRSVETSSKPPEHKQEAQSLMDIDFSRGKHNPKRLADSSNEDSFKQTGDQKEWRKEHRNSRHSDSEAAKRWDASEKKGEKTSLKNASKLSSLHSPLVVDMHEKDLNKCSSTPAEPRSLLEACIPSIEKRPMSLLDLPNARDDRQQFKRKSDNWQSRDRGGCGGGERRKLDLSKKRPLEDSSGGLRGKRSRAIKSSVHLKCQSAKTAPGNRIIVCEKEKYSFLIIPSSCQTTGLHGRSCVTLILGNVSILAFKLKPGVAYDVYSPLTGGLLSVYANGDHMFNAADVRRELKKYGISESYTELDDLGENTVAILKLRKLDSVICDYITSFIPYTQIFLPAPSREEQGVCCRGVTLPKLGLKVAPHSEMTPTCLTVSEEYQELLDRWAHKLTAQEDGAPVILICGPKNTGKSTLNRMLINTALNSVDKVAYLECDVGQTEFSAPATVSLHVVTEPVLGPPFCQQKQAERMVFYGDVTPTTDPTTYVTCLRYVFEAYKELSPPLPLVVNTMGFTEGLGLMLLVDTVQLVRPTLVVQIESFNQSNNLPAITQEMVALDRGWTVNKSPVSDPAQKVAETHAHELVLIPTFTSQRRDFSVKLRPVDLRNLTLLSTLSAGLEQAMTLTCLPPYTVPYAQLGIHICHHRLPPGELLDAMDASVVALCVSSLSQGQKDNEEMPYVFEKMPICECLGLGIVRGIDKTKGLLYLVTTLPRKCLRRMNTLLRGSLAIPDQIMLKQTTPKPLCYVDALAPSTAVTGSRPRSRMPRVSQGGAKT